MLSFVHYCVGCVGVLVGTKVDLAQRRVVSEEDARKTAQTIEAEYFECSAVCYMRSEVIMCISCLAQ